MASHGTVAELGSSAFRHLEVPELDLAQNERCRKWVPPRSVLLWPLYINYGRRNRVCCVLYTFGRVTAC